MPDRSRGSIEPPQETPSPIPVEQQIKLRRVELGLPGLLFSSNARENAPFVIAITIIVFSFIGMFIVLFSNKDIADPFKVFSALIVAALSFIGGYGTGRRR